MASRIVTGLRAGHLYTIQVRPFDPRWSNKDIQRFCAWCATAQHLGWDEPRAVNAAEAVVFRKKLESIQWPDATGLDDDIQELLEAGRPV